MIDPLTRRDFVKAGAVTAAGAALGLVPTYTVYAGNPTKEKTAGILNYNEQMEYRRGGKTNVLFSAVCLGGHWKRINSVLPKEFEVVGAWGNVTPDNTAFSKNRYDVVTRCIERGINYIDACTLGEGIAYARALKGRRDKMYLGFSDYAREPQGVLSPKKPPHAPGVLCKDLKDELDQNLKTIETDYVDVWRISCGAASGFFSDNQMDEVCEALAWAKKTGKARWTGVSSHDRPHLKKWIERNPKELEVVLTPYSAKTKMTGGPIGKPEELHAAFTVKDKDDSWENSLWRMIQKCDVAWFAIKPFANGTVFKHGVSEANAEKAENDKMARLTIRAVLSNPALTAPIPGMISPEQVDNICLAVLQRRELDEKERAELDAALEERYAAMPPHYHWLRDWGYA